MKILWNQARFELFSYLLGELLEMRKETQTALFDVLEEIAAYGLGSIGVDLEKLG